MTRSCRGRPTPGPTSARTCTSCARPAASRTRPPGGETSSPPGLDLDIWGRPHCGYEDFRPMAHVPPRGRATWQVAMAHGHLTRGPADLRHAYPISPAEIAGSGRGFRGVGALGG